jgi:hypothetical protein
MTFMKKTAVIAGATLCVLAGGCSQETGSAASDASAIPASPGSSVPATSPAPSASPDTAASPAPSASSPAATADGSAVPSEHRELVDTFVSAINRGDETAVGETFAADAVFDSVGRIYEGRDEIMDRFLVPEVIRVGGQYTLLAVTAGEEGRVVAEYDFRTGGGGREHVTYDCAVNEGQFTNCVGRYV